MKPMRSTATCLVLAIALAGSARAALLSGTSVVVAPDEHVEGNLYARGAGITIDGEVGGDAVVGASTVVVNGHVRGDLLFVGGTLIITGVVDGDVRAFGGEVLLAGPTGGDALVTGRSVTIRAAIGGDAIVAGNETRVASVVAGDLIATGGRLRLERDAVVHGDVRYAGDRLDREAGSVVLGQVLETRSNLAAMRGAGLMGWLRSVIGMCLFGLIWLAMFRDFAHRAFQTLRTRPGLSFGVGVAAFFGAPVVLALALIVGALLGGWWISLFGLAIYLMSLVVTVPLVAAYLGQRLVRRGEERHEAGPMFLFIILFSVLIAIPVVGVVVAVVIMAFGLGTIAVTFASRPRPPAAPVSSPTPFVPSI